MGGRRVEKRFEEAEVEMGSIAKSPLLPHSRLSRKETREVWRNIHREAGGFSQSERMRL